MKSVTRTADIAAAPEVIWAFLCDLPGWADWDPDIAAVTSFQGTPEDGGSLDIRMTGGLSGTIRFPELTPNRHMRWRFEGLRGLVTAEGVFDLEPLADGAHTRVHYRFGMAGIAGALVRTFNNAAIVNGVEGGLANIVAANGGPVTGGSPPFA